MKHQLIAAGLVAALPLLSLSANLVTNGDFETNFGTVGTTFTLTPNWFNRGSGGQETNARANNLNQAGSTYNAIINDRYDVVNATSDFDSSAFGPITHSQLTGYTIQTGDSFTVSYDWRTAADWNLGFDEVRFVLFATDDNTLGGNVTWFETLDSGTAAATATWAPVSDTSSVVTPAAVGQDLFVNFYGFQNNGAVSPTTGFARVDNISVEAIPEPGVLISILLGTVVLTCVKRRGNR